MILQWTSNGVHCKKKKISDNICMLYNKLKIIEVHDELFILNKNLSKQKRTEKNTSPDLFICIALIATHSKKSTYCDWGNIFIVIHEIIKIHTVKHIRSKLKMLHISDLS